MEKIASPFRVLHIVPTMGRDSGTMNVVMNLYRHIDRSRVRFDFLYLDERPDDYKAEAAALGAGIFKLRKPGLLGAGRFISEMDDFYRVRGRDYPVVHLHELLLSGVCLGLAGKHGIAHRVAHAHSSRYSKNAPAALRNYFLCLPLKLFANHRFACSRAAGERYFGSSPFRVLRNAIDCRRFAYDGAARRRIREELGLGDAFVMGHAGRFSSEKNHAFLLEIFREALKAEPSALLLLAGGGGLRPEIERRAAALGLAGRVIFAGCRPDVELMMQAMDVFVLPSLFEGLPLTLIEAQASGLKCFASSEVAREADVTGLVRYLPLGLSPAGWAEEILKCRGRGRSDVSAAVRAGGYEIRDTAAELLRYYEELTGRD